MGLLFPFLSQKELETMAFDHKYTSSGASIIDMLFLKRYSTWLAGKLPLKHDPKASFHWTAPNTLTFIGLLCMVIPALVIYVTSHDLKSPSPQWSYFATALGIFCYQTLDELDGKQARRTGSSTPLGELFDHGCDAISTFVTVGACLCICQTGYTLGAYSAYVFSLMAFQGAHIQTYCKGYLYFGIIDVAEAQWSGILMSLACGVIHHNFFSDGDFFGFPRQVVPISFVVGGSGVAILRNFYSTTFTTKNNVIYAYSSPLALWGAWLLLFVLTTVWFKQTQGSLQGSDRILFLSTLGLLNASQSVTIIVAHMARTAVPLWNYLRMLPILLAIANAHFQLVSNSQCVAMVFSFSAVHFVHYAASLSVQIASFLGVSTFKVLVMRYDPAMMSREFFLPSDYELASLLPDEWDAKDCLGSWIEAP